MTLQDRADAILKARYAIDIDGRRFRVIYSEVGGTTPEIVSTHLTRLAALASAKRHAMQDAREIAQ
jgi:hypothetical protein